MKHTHIILLLLSLLAVACDNIAPEDRLIYVKPQAAHRAVLLVDFTGQACVNCPMGSQVIERLQQEYGPDTVIAVGMYSGPFGQNARGTLLPLTTAQGNEYFNHWQLSAQPVCMIDLKVKSEAYNDWPTRVGERLRQPSPLQLDITEASLNETGKADICVKAMGTDGATNGHLMLWLVEDSIVGQQRRHDPIDNPNVTITDNNYLHRHVFRATVNGSWGDDFTIAEAEEKTLRFTTQTDDSWNKSQLSVVAFVYNDDGVQQAAIRHITE